MFCLSQFYFTSFKRDCYTYLFTYEKKTITLRLLFLFKNNKEVALFLQKINDPLHYFIIPKQPTTNSVHNIDHKILNNLKSEAHIK